MPPAGLLDSISNIFGYVVQPALCRGAVEHSQPRVNRYSSQQEAEHQLLQLLARIQRDAVRSVCGGSSPVHSAARLCEYLL